MNPKTAYEHMFSPIDADSPVNVKTPGVLTYMHSPHVELAPDELANSGASFAFLGVPFDAGNIGRPGSYAAPHSLRKASTKYFSYMWEYSVDISVACPVIDCGDVKLAPGNTEKSHQQIYNAIKMILEAGITPIIAGGDHSIAIPAGKALSDVLGDRKMGYLHFGAHLDMADSWAGERNVSISSTARLTELLNLKIENATHIGARNSLNPKDVFDLSKERGLRFIPMTEVLDRGINESVGEAIERTWMGTDKQYLSFDLNVLDSSCAPGVTMPEPGGIDAREIIQAARLIGAKGRPGIIEISELCPHEDHAEVTAKIAACILSHILASIAKSTGHRIDETIRRTDLI